MLPARFSRLRDIIPHLQEPLPGKPRATKCQWFPVDTKPPAPCYGPDETIVYVRRVKLGLPALARAEAEIWPDHYLWPSVEPDGILLTSYSPAEVSGDGLVAQKYLSVPHYALEASWETKRKACGRTCYIEMRLAAPASWRNPIGEGEYEVRGQTQLFVRLPDLAKI